MSEPRDQYSITGKIPVPQETAAVLVVGAGDAGLAAAAEAASRGSHVVLVDENPLDPALYGIDVPFSFGGRMTGVVRHRGQMLEQVLSSRPELQEVIEAGVDVRLGTTAWGLYCNSASLKALPSSMVGLADAERSWLCGFDHLILATGARDLSLAFNGWDQPGVVGAKGLTSLIETYNAFAGRQVVILGSGALAARTALLVKRRGYEVIALVEVLPTARCDERDLRELDRAEIRVLTNHTPKRAVGGHDGVESLIVVNPEGVETQLTCDTVCFAVGVVPAIELLQSAGGEVIADSRRGGHVPLLSGARTSLSNVYAVGPCAGISDLLHHSQQSARQAARQALCNQPVEAVDPGPDAWEYQVIWYRALVRMSEASVVVCQCEGVTRTDLLEVRAPRYLGPPTLQAKTRDIGTMLNDGPVDQDQIKRLTRACMGVCQARRCREQVSFTLAEAAGIAPNAVPLAGYRAPVRPIALKILADLEEIAALTTNWHPWFGIRGQWAMYEDIGTEREFTSVFGGS
jgi:thioredoxin reductase